MTEAERTRFDQLVDRAIEALPESIRQLLDQVPVIVLDHPTEEMMLELGETPDALDEICGLHSGRSFLEESSEGPPQVPSDIHLFRLGIVSLAGGWDQPTADDFVLEEITTTLLHEIGHQFGLEEDDLDRLGYS